MRQAKLGFTLLEILVVLVIISIVASMAMLTIGHNQNKEMETFSKELAQTLTLGQEQALLQPATLGLIFTAKSYGFYQFHQVKDKISWQALSDTDLGSHPLPSGIEVRLKIAEEESSQAQAGNEAEPLPKLLISPNGNLTPFKILIGPQGGKPHYQITGTTDGTVTHEVYRG